MAARNALLLLACARAAGSADAVGLQSNASSSAHNVTVRILHPSGTGGTTVCASALHTTWVRLTPWQRRHNCNLKGTGPRFHDEAAARESGVCRPADTNWVHFEYAFDAEFPCGGRDVKHVVLSAKTYHSCGPGQGQLSLWTGSN